MFLELIQAVNAFLKCCTLFIVSFVGITKDEVVCNKHFHFAILKKITNISLLNENENSETDML